MVKTKKIDKKIEVEKVTKIEPKIEPKIEVKIEPKIEPVATRAAVKTEKEVLLDLYQVLKDRNIRSISDIENLIAKAE